MLEDDATALEWVQDVDGSFPNLADVPTGADFVFLAATADARINLRFLGLRVDRVLDGYGTYGTIVTLRGAERALGLLRLSSHPVDIALMQMSLMLRMYAPRRHGVRHMRNGTSTRKRQNSNAQ